MYYVTKCISCMEYHITQKKETICPHCGMFYSLRPPASLPRIEFSSRSYEECKLWIEEKLSKMALGTY
ncbi:MAG: hypothetical protein QXX95_04140 [Nitrososphaerales archaeon]